MYDKTSPQQAEINGLARNIAEVKTISNPHVIGRATTSARRKPHHKDEKNDINLSKTHGTR